MRTRSRAALLAAAVALAGLSTSACGYIGMLKAQMAFKDANVAYQAQDYKKAIEKYKEALEHKPDLAVAYFYLGNSYDNLYKPARKGEAANDANLQEAVNYYKKATETIQEPKLRKLSYEYLLNSYGSEKLNDPSQAEPVVKKMIEMEPDEPTNYFALAKIYEDGGRYDEAEQTLMKAKEVKPNDPLVYTTISGFYNRQGNFEKTMEALNKAAELDSNNPQAHHLLAPYYQEKVTKDYKLTDDQKRTYIDAGLAAEERALKINPDYVDALVYKNILLRLKGNIEKDPAKRADYYKQADTIRNRAMELQKKKTAGTN